MFREENTYENITDSGYASSRTHNDNENEVFKAYLNQKLKSTD